LNIFKLGELLFIHGVWCLFSREARSSIEDFLSRYGEKALLVLKIAYSIARDPSIDHRLGDFSYKHIVFKLAEMGLTYNPVNILKIMEKTYGIIEKTYSSKNQTWWRFKDIDAVRDALGEAINPSIPEDPGVRLLMVKYRSLEPWRLHSTLERLAFKDRLSEVDKEVFRRIVFNELEKITSILNEMMRYEEVFSSEIKMLNDILYLAEVVARKLEKPGATVGSSTGVPVAREVLWRNDNT